MKMLSSTRLDERKNLVVAGGAQREWARLARSFRRHPFDLHRSASGLSQVLDECRKLPACVLLVDLDFLVNSRPPAELSKIAQVGRSVAVLVLVENESDEILEFLLSRGCMGVLQARSTPARLRRAVGAVMAGEIWAPRKLLSRIFQNIFFRRDPRNLTTREVEILALAAQGLTNQQIAEALNIGRETVRWNMRMIYGKLGVHDRESASALAFGTGLRKPVLPELRLSKKLLETAHEAAKSSVQRRG
jgi:DNA-binding NarL/FixJ family response regulator